MGVFLRRRYLATLGRIRKEKEKGKNKRQVTERGERSYLLGTMVG